MVERLTEAALTATAAHFERRLAAIRTAIRGETPEIARRNLLELAARWAPDTLAHQVGDILELAGLEGREAVLAEAEGTSTGFADGIGVTFQEQIKFLRQKRPMETRVWTDAMHGTHDRAFVIAGATDLAMLDDFQQALIATMPTRDLKAFGRVFDELVEKYGWSYNGGRDWRVRTIFETNVRTSYMAGRLAQMRDPDMVKARPYWQYVHADTRIPVSPRKEHVAWDGLVLAWDDPWWDTHYPPNGWKCGCGVRPLSEADVQRLGKDGPDVAPAVTRHMERRGDGEVVEVTDGIEYGWDYQPGSQWADGLVPEQLEMEAAQLGKSVIPSGAMPQIVSIDDAEPIGDLMASARDFNSGLLPPGDPPEDYIRRFLAEFGAAPDRPVLWQDRTGARIAIGAGLFRKRNGEVKLQRGRDVQVLRLAEAIMDPDEIWLGVRARRTGLDDPLQHFTTRRYIRVSPDYGVMMMFELGARHWSWITGFAPEIDGKNPDLEYLDALRVGKLLFKRRPG